jgi:hypothetical protein
VQLDDECNSSTIVTAGLGSSFFTEDIGICMDIGWSIVEAEGSTMSGLIGVRLKLGGKFKINSVGIGAVKRRKTKKQP